MIENIHTFIFDFDGVLTNNKVILDEKGKESVICDRADGLAFDILRKYRSTYRKNYEIFILSTEKNPIVTMRAKKHKIDCYQGVNEKLSFIKEYILKKSSKDLISEDGIIYLGNDLNDYSSMKACGFSVAPCDAHPEIIKIADIVINKKGGDGFVRSFIEEFFKKNNISIIDLI